MGFFTIEGEKYMAIFGFCIIIDLVTKFLREKRINIFNLHTHTNKQQNNYYSRLYTWFFARILIL